MNKHIQQNIHSIPNEFMYRYFHENAERRFATELNDFLFWRKGKFLRPNEKEKIIASYLKEEIDDFFINKKIHIPRLQFFITSACTLRCSECNALIPDLHQPFSPVKNYFLNKKDFFNACRMCRGYGEEILPGIQMES